MGKVYFLYGDDNIGNRGHEHSFSAWTKMVCPVSGTGSRGTEGMGVLGGKM
jgi:hypothetical protein